MTTGPNGQMQSVRLFGSGNPKTGMQATPWSPQRSTKPESPEHESVLKNQVTAQPGTAKKELHPILPPGLSNASSDRKTPAPQIPDHAPSPPNLKIEPPAPRPPLSDEEVTKHTAAQWKYLAVPFSEPEKYPEYLTTSEKDYLKHGIIGSRVRGKKHKHGGSNCDDWFKTDNVGPIEVIAVADGAGSKKFSRIGAHAACETAVKYITGALGAMGGKDISLELAMPQESEEFQAAGSKMCEIIQHAVVQAASAVDREAEARKSKESFSRLLGGRTPVTADFACTLLVAVIVPLGGRRYFVGTCQVGDGMIAVYDTEGSFDSAVRLLAEPDSGDFSGETEFITSPSIRDPLALQSRTFAFQGPCDAVMVMTDGVADDYYPNKTELPRLYLDMVANGILSEKRNAGTARPEDVPADIPEPVSYPWVNNPSVKVALQYSDRLCKELSLDLRELWEKRGAIMPGVLETLDGGTQLGDERAARLQTWLDNYVTRGSFDDRTLVIADLREERP